MSRLIVVGDIHGCLAEVRTLLKQVEASSADRVIAVGDFVSKGPDVAGAIRFWRDHGYEAVLGNNEDKFLAAAARGLSEVSAANAETGRREELVAWLRGLPLQIDAPEFNVTVAHAGPAPPAVEATWDTAEIREVRLRLRYLRKSFFGGRWVRVRKGDERNGDVFWTELWQEPRTVVYGHTPFPSAVVRSNSVGIDTGCVYGGALTAAVFEGAAEPRIVSVPAERAYATRK